MIKRVGPLAVALRGVIVVAGLVSLITSGLLGDPRVEFVAVALMLVVATAYRPDSVIPMAAIGALAVQWTQAVRPMSVLGSIVLGLCILVVHVASARVAAMPHHAPYDSAATARWVGQCATVAVITGLVWAIVTLLSDTTPPGGVPVTVAGLLVFAAFGVALAAWLRQPDS